MIGMFDSGVGGLAVYQLLKGRLPEVPIVYLADQAFAPYGTKPADQLIERTKRVTQTLVDRGAKMIVIACNTATLTAIDELRQAFPDTPFVGMVPAVKPAAQVADKIIVLGTPSTVANPKCRALCEEHATGKQLWQIGSVELVRQVERGDLESTYELERLLARPIQEGAEALVIGCTHFSFLLPAIERRWPVLKIFDGRFGTVDQATRLAQGNPAHQPAGPKTDQFLTTGARTIAFVTPPISFARIQL